MSYHGPRDLWDSILLTSLTLFCKHILHSTSFALSALGSGRTSNLSSVWLPQGCTLFISLLKILFSFRIYSSHSGQRVLLDYPTKIACN